MTELDLILKKIRARMNDLADDIALGAAKDYAHYMRLVGTVEGLALVERDIKDIQERTDSEE